jgi:twitching motility protein PilT
MLASQARRFAEALVERHVITRQTLDQALTESSESGRPIDEVIADLTEVSAKDIAGGHAAAAGLTFIDLDAAVVHPDAASAVPEALCRQHSVVGVSIDGHRLTVAFPMPAVGADMKAVSNALRTDGYEVIAVGAERSEIVAALDEMAGVAGVGLDKRGNVHSSHEQRLIDLIVRTMEMGGSDLHLAAGEPPFIRILGELMRLPDAPVLSAAEVRELSLSIITARQRERFEERRELDTAYAIPGKTRLRVNLFVQRGAVGASLRVIPFEVVPFERIGIPDVVATFADLPRGLVLVTGPTGSGKSTTLAALIDLVNQRRQAHILTIEDPIEFVHRSKRSLVNQREVGDDTAGFSSALTQALRQDPDVILVGEMRDLETVSTAISAAETGHLVFATLHTQDSSQTVDRVVDVFPAEQQAQVRTQLANTIQGIVSQQLLLTADGRARVPACEVLLATPALRALIRDGKVHQIPNTISSGRKVGMQTFDDSLAGLVRSGQITADQAYTRARDPQGLANVLNGQAPVLV